LPNPTSVAQPGEAYPLRDRLWQLAVGIVAICVLAFGIAASDASYNTVGGVATVPLAILVGATLSLALARRQNDPWVGRIVVVGYALKVMASGVFFWLVFHGPGGDAGRYHRNGAEISSAVWDGDFSALIEGGLTGTAMMEQLAGALYTVTGPAAATGFIIFATLSFIGSYLFFRAFSIAVPGGNRRLYATITFLVPSVVFWPSSLGKEAWMIFMLGLSTYGAAQLLTGHRGIAPLVVGLPGIALLRPHMAAITVTALAAAPLVPRRAELSPWTRRGRTVLLLFVFIAGSAATIAAQRTFGLSSVTPSTVTGFLEVVAENTATGGSQFSNVETVNPLLSPLALVSVLLRPFPHEASNLIMLLASLEGMFVALLVLRRRRSFGAAIRSTFRAPFVSYVTVYVMLFALSYSFFNNLGLLARERVQLLPFFFVLLAHPLIPRRATAAPWRPTSSVVTTTGERIEA
jgi:hypothetical protein